MSEKNRKVMTGAQTAKVALEAAKGHKTINEIAVEFGVHPTQVGLWKKALLENAGCHVSGDHIPIRSWPLFRARDILRDLIQSTTTKAATPDPSPSPHHTACTS